MIVFGRQNCPSCKGDITRYMENINSEEPIICPSCGKRLYYLYLYGNGGLIPRFLTTRPPIQFYTIFYLGLVTLGLIAVKLGAIIYQRFYLR